MNIIVLAGGLSPERDVSLSSGSLIANALMEKGHSVLLYDVYEGSVDGTETFRTKQDVPYTYTIPETEPDLAALKAKYGNRASLIDDNLISVCKKADIVFIALHGAIGENGQLQATLDCHGIRYTGSSYAGCLLAMDKDLSKRLLRQAGIPTADWVLLEHEIPDTCPLPFPCVVKPCSNGSSIGVSIVHNDEEFQQAMQYAHTQEARVLVERFIAGREFSAGILGDKPLPVIEIVPKVGFYDYKNKYQSGMTEEICPAILTEEQTTTVQKLALAVHRTLMLRTYSRIDFILGDDGNFVCLEANTLPGMTPNSLLPQEAAAVGIPYPDLCVYLVEQALQ